MLKKSKYRVAMTDTFEGEQFTFALTFNVANKSTAYYMASAQFPGCPVVEVRRLPEVTVSGFNMNIVEVLTKAKAVIADPANWIQGEYSNHDKTCFCSLGAVASVINRGLWGISEEPAVKLLGKVVYVPQGYNFAEYNDSHTHAEVMEAFDKAIELAKVEEGDVVKV